MPRVINLIAVLLFFALPLGANAEKTEEIKDVNKIIEKVIAAYGGPAKLKQTGSVYTKGVISAFMRGDRGTYERYFMRPGRLRVSLRYSQVPEERLLLDREGYRSIGRNQTGGHGPMSRADGPKLDAMLYQYQYLDLPYALMNGELKPRYLGTETITGKEADALEIIAEGLPRMNIYVDSLTGLLLKAKGFFDIKGRVATLSAEFRDYKDVEGMRMPFSITNYASGMKIGMTVITEYRINPELPPDIWNIER